MGDGPKGQVQVSGLQTSLPPARAHLSLCSLFFSGSKSAASIRDSIFNQKMPLHNQPNKDCFSA